MCHLSKKDLFGIWSTRERGANLELQLSELPEKKKKEWKNTVEEYSTQGENT